MGLLVKPVVMRVGAMEKFPDRGVPRMNITLDGVSLEEINAGSKETKYEGNKLDLYEGGEVREFEGVQVKGRGNSTWDQEKKPYQIKFSQRVDLFGLGKNKKWILLANYFDESLMRNDIAMLFAEMLEVRYNVRGEFAEVYFDGKYEGLYYVLPKIEIAKGSVNLKELDGVIFELDTLHRYEEECYESYLGECLVLKDTVTKEQGMTQKVAMDFMKDFDDFEMAVEKGDYERVTELIDVDSFVKYFIVNEFTVNPDAYVSSFYLYRDGADDRIHAGPVWDFDLALGNRNWSLEADEAFYSPSEEMFRKREVFTQDGYNGDSLISRLLYYLEGIPDFRNRIRIVFQEKMSGRKAEFQNRIMDRVSSIYDAVDYNQTKWGVGDFEDEIDLLMKWIAERYDYFEMIYSDDDMDVVFDDNSGTNVLQKSEGVLY